MECQDHAPDHYEICIQGHLHDRWVDWFGNMTIERMQNGQTRLRGPVIDQAALHGILRRVRDTGLPLVWVARIPPAQSSDPSDSQQTIFNTGGTNHDRRSCKH